MERVQEGVKEAHAYRTRLLVGIFLMVIVMAVWGMASYTIITENRYVGDASTATVYDLAYCNTDHLPRSQRVSFKNLEEAKQNGYHLASC